MRVVRYSKFLIYLNLRQSLQRRLHYSFYHHVIIVLKQSLVQQSLEIWG